MEQELVMMVPLAEVDVVHHWMLDLMWRWETPERPGAVVIRFGLISTH